MSNRGSSSSNGSNAKPIWLNKIAKEKTALLQSIFEMEPIHVDVRHPVTRKLRPRCQGEDILRAWDECYADDPIVKSIVVDTAIGPSTPGKDYLDDASANPAMPYQQLRALVGDGGRWKWPEIWKNLDILPRRGPAWRHIDDPSNMGAIANPNPHIVPLDCLVVGGGPVGLRLAIELVLGGHRVTIFERRREVRDPDSGELVAAGFTNRVNRPHIKNFCRNDLDRLNGRSFMTPKMCYPVFTNTHTSSIGIDEAQMLLLKTALLLGVRFELGVGYVDAEIDVDEASSSQRPSWNVEYTADETACERYGKTAAGGKQRFDALFGCDGGNSRVRNTQVDWLGVPKTRRYKKMYGIVANLQKCSRAKLRSLGFESGLEPEDRAGNLTGVFFYKASYHNYLIVHPSAEEMEANGIPWRGIFGFDRARSEAVSGGSAETAALKGTLKAYMTKKAKALGIPLDETLSNGGFVDAPNDVMGFDFSEFYNCENSAACSVPPLDWNREEDGDWEVHCPLIALAGDSVADPNWLLGVGLQRGWNSALDACFYADNVYNNRSFNGKPPDVDEPIDGPVEWSEHLGNLANLMTVLGNSSRDGKLSEEMSSGTHDEKGPVVLQLARFLSSREVDAPVPQYLPVVEPWYRYREYERDVRKNYKGQKLFDHVHPTTTREVAIFRKSHRFVERGAYLRTKITRPTAAMLTWPKRFECSAFWCDMSMKLLRIDGKAAPGATSGHSENVALYEEKKEEENGEEAKRRKTHSTVTQRSDDARNSIVAAAVATRGKAIESKQHAGAFDKTKEAKKSEEAERPKNGSAKFQAMSKRRPGGSLRNDIIAATRSSRPLDILKHGTGGGGIDGLLSNAAERAGGGDDRVVVAHAVKDDPPLPPPSGSAAAADFPGTNGDAGRDDATGDLRGDDDSATFPRFDIPSALFSRDPTAGGGGGGGDSNDPMRGIRLLAVRSERELCQARLEVAQAKVAKAEAEEEVVRAEKACARKEVEALNRLLEAYADVESKLRSSTERRK